jgi:excisionase family DNA binding protein
METRMTPANDGGGNQIAPLHVKLRYTKKEAAQMLSISLRMLDYSIQAGEISVRRDGTKVLITHQELQRYARRDHSGRPRGKEDSSKHSSEKNVQ